jgi:hypothetical protein
MSFCCVGHMASTQGEKLSAPPRLQVCGEILSVLSRCPIHEYITR